MKYKKLTYLTAVIATLLATSAISQAAIFLPTAGNSITFEATDFDLQAGTTTVADDLTDFASADNYVDGLEGSTAGGGNGDFLSFDVSNVNSALSYTISFSNRRNGAGSNTMVPAILETYSVITGPSYTLETTTEAIWRSGGWALDFIDADGASSFQLDTGTTALRIESLANGGNGIAHLDTITITALIPEPSSTALLGLGGLALILRRRK